MDPFAIVQQGQNECEHAGEEHEEHAHPANPKVAIRGSGKEDKSRTEHGTC